MKFEAGMMVGDQVRLVQPIGAQSSGNVWIADQLDWKKQVVVKFVTTGVPLDDLEALIMFIEKAADGAAVDSPRVVQAFDHGLTDDGLPYVVTEWLQGQSLDQRLAKGRLQPVEAGKILAQVAEAVTAAHAAGIVHAGLEPGNIFLCKAAEEPSVKVLNYGVAKARPPRRTSNYISPEQYLLKPADRRSDLFSLGVVAYEMLTGEIPFTAQARRQVEWEFAPPSEMWLADIPDEVDQFFHRALSKQPDERFESAGQLADEFIRLMPGIEGKPKKREPAAPAVGLQKVIEVGTDESGEAAPSSEPDATTIDVDE